MCCAICGQCGGEQLIIVHTSVSESTCHSQKDSDREHMLGNHWKEKSSHPNTSQTEAQSSVLPLSLDSVSDKLLGVLVHSQNL